MAEIKNNISQQNNEFKTPKTDLLLLKNDLHDFKSNLTVSRDKADSFKNDLNASEKMSDTFEITCNYLKTIYYRQEIRYLLLKNNHMFLKINRFLQMMSCKKSKRRLNYLRVN